MEDGGEDPPDGAGCVLWEAHLLDGLDDPGVVLPLAGGVRTLLVLRGQVPSHKGLGVKVDMESWVIGYNTHKILGTIIKGVLYSVMFFFCKRIMACWDNSHGLLGTRVVGYLVQSYWIQESLVNGYKSHGLLGIRSMGYWVQ